MSVQTSRNDNGPSVSDCKIRNVALILLVLITLGSAGATILHILEPRAHPTNLVLPPLICLIHFGLLLYLIHRQNRTLQVFWISSFILFLSTTIATWSFTLQAAFSPDIELVNTLPPICSYPIVGITTMFIFARPKQVMMAGILAWVLIAFPILLYLGFHPEELLSPRGQEMTLTLGPFMLGVFTLVPFHRGVEKTVQSLLTDRDSIQLQADLDPLTQTYNRRGFENIIAEIVDLPPAQLGIILFDIDHFKKINDTFGHKVGDTVLQEIVIRSRESLRKDDIIVRWGGEEFLVLIQGADAKALCKISEHLRRAIADNPIEPVNQVTVSIGVSQLNADDSMESLIQRADEAMYIAKHQGRNRVILG